MQFRAHHKYLICEAVYYDLRCQTLLKNPRKQKYVIFLGLILNDIVYKLNAG